MKNKKSNIWSTNEHVSIFGMKKNNLLWHSSVKMSRKMVNFFVPCIGNFLLEIGKNILFAIGNVTRFRSSKWAKKKTLHSDDDIPECIFLKS